MQHRRIFLKKIGLACASFVMCMVVLAAVMSWQVHTFKKKTKFLLEAEADVTVGAVQEKRAEDVRVLKVKFIGGTVRPMVFTGEIPVEGQTVRVRYGCPFKGDELTALQILDGQK